MATAGSEPDAVSLAFTRPFPMVAERMESRKRVKGRKLLLRPRSRSHQQQRQSKNKERKPTGGGGARLTAAAGVTPCAMTGNGGTRPPPPPPPPAASSAAVGPRWQRSVGKQGRTALSLHIAPRAQRGCRRARSSSRRHGIGRRRHCRCCGHRRLPPAREGPAPPLAAPPAHQTACVVPR